MLKSCDPRLAEGIVRFNAGFRNLSFVPHSIKTWVILDVVGDQVCDWLNTGSTPGTDSTRVGIGGKNRTDEKELHDPKTTASRTVHNGAKNKGGDGGVPSPPGGAGQLGGLSWPPGSHA